MVALQPVLSLVVLLFCLEWFVVGGVFDTLEKFVQGFLVFDQVVCELLGLDQFGHFFLKYKHFVRVCHSKGCPCRICT